MHKSGLRRHSDVGGFSAAASSIHESAVGPTVFVCYAHDSPEHKHAVLHLAEFLAHNGIAVTIDQLADARRRDWGRWAIDHISAADFVLIIASPDLKAAADTCRPTRRSSGVRSELSVIRDLLHHDREVWTMKLLPVLLPGRVPADIPLFLQPHSVDHYRVSEFSVTGTEDLLRALTNQPRRVPPRQGVVPLLPPLPPALAGPTAHPTRSGVEPERFRCALPGVVVLLIVMTVVLTSVARHAPWSPRRAIRTPSTLRNSAQPARCWRRGLRG